MAAESLKPDARLTPLSGVRCGSVRQPAPSSGPDQCGRRVVPGAAPDMIDDWAGSSTSGPRNSLDRSGPGWASARTGPQPDRQVPLRTRVVSGFVAADEFRRLQLPFQPCCCKDRGHVRVGHEALPTLLVPVEDPPNSVALQWVSEE